MEFERFLLFLCGFASIPILFCFWRRASSRSTVWEHGMIAVANSTLWGLFSCGVRTQSESLLDSQFFQPRLSSLNSLLLGGALSSFVLAGLLGGEETAQNGNLRDLGLQTETRKAKEKWIYNTTFETGKKREAGWWSLRHRFGWVFCLSAGAQLCFSDFYFLSFLTGIMRFPWWAKWWAKASCLNWLSWCVVSDLFILSLFSPLLSSSPSLLFRVLVVFNGVCSLPGIWASVALEYGTVETKVLEFAKICDKVSALAFQKQFIPQTQRLPLCILENGNGFPTFLFREISNGSFWFGSPCSAKSSSPILSDQEVESLTLDLLPFLPLTLATSVVIPYVGWIVCLSFPLVHGAPWTRERGIGGVHSWISSTDVFASRASGKDRHWFHWTPSDVFQSSTAIWIEPWMWDSPLLLKFQLEEATRELKRTYAHLDAAHLLDWTTQ